MSYIAIAGGGGRTILTAATNYYVTTTGSDSNPGTLAQPWATPQHAINFLSENIDFAGFLVTVNIGTGTFTGVDLRAFVGGGKLFLLGAGSALTTFKPSGSGDGAITAVDVIMGLPLYYSGLSLINGGSIDTCVRVGIGNQVWAVHPDFSTADNVYLPLSVQSPGSPSGIGIWVEPGAFWSDGEGTGTASIGVASGNNSWVSFFRFDPTAEQIQVGDAYTLIGTPSFSQAFIFCQGAMQGYGTFSGAATGTRFIASQNGSIDANDPAGTFFPGSTVGKILSGGQYSGITDFVGVVGSLPSANIQGAKAFVTDALAATFGSAPTGGHGTFVPVYNDGTQWLMG